MSKVGYWFYLYSQVNFLLFNLLMSILILFASLISFYIHYLIVVCDILHLFYCCVCVGYCVYVDPWGHGKDEEYHGFAINIVLL